MDSIDTSGCTYDGRGRTVRLVIGPSSVEKPSKICGLFRGVRKGSRRCTAISDFQGCVSGILVPSTITSSSKWDQDRQMARGVGGCVIMAARDMLEPLGTYSISLSMGWMTLFLNRKSLSIGGTLEDWSGIQVF